MLSKEDTRALGRSSFTFVLEKTCNERPFRPLVVPCNGMTFDTTSGILIFTHTSLANAIGENGSVWPCTSVNMVAENSNAPPGRTVFL